MKGYRAALFDVALGQYGYITTADAMTAGVPPVELRKMSEHEGLVNVARGLYRFETFQPTEYDQYMEAVLRSGADAHLVGDSVLALHHLALVNPLSVTVATPHRVRRKTPREIIIIKAVYPPEDLTRYEGIPSTTVYRALGDAQSRVMASRLRDAVREAHGQGLLTQRQASQLDRRFEDDTSSANQNPERLRIP